MSNDLLDRLPGGKIICKDLSIAASIIPGNPYCRYDTNSEERKYCSKDLWENADTSDRFVIPEDDTIPRELVECECCGNESYQTEAGECGRCGKPIFDCPGCGEEVHGKPSQCPHCESGYRWDDGSEDEDDSE
jgi:hypothetical protein